jgi:iron complex transport system ATP-binding protein
VNTVSVEIENLSFVYGTHQVLENVTFTAPSGTMTAVLGQNGAGKSTLFRCILGFLKWDSGSIRCDGADMRHISPKELARRVAYIPQSSNPVFNYTVLDTVLMGTANQLSALGAPKEAQRQQAMAVLEDLGIAQLSSKGYGRISGGERQLTLIARALVQQAKVLIMDEPTANLDYGNQFRVLEKIQGLTQQGYTVLMSTHNPEQALRFADEILLLHGGKVLGHGAPETVLTPDHMEQVFGLQVAFSHVTAGKRQVPVCIPIASTRKGEP